MRLGLVFLFGFLLSSGAWGFKLGLLELPEGPAVFSALSASLVSKFQAQGLSLHSVSYVVEDPWLAIRKARWDGVGVLIGPLGRTDPEPFIRAAQSYRIPLILTHGDFDPMRVPGEPFQGVFRTGVSYRLAAKGLLRCLSRKNWREVGLLLSLDQAGRSGIKWLKAYAWEYRIHLARVDWFGPRDTALAHKLEPFIPMQALIVWCGREAALNVARAIKELGLKLPVFFGPEVADERFLEAHPAFSGLYFPGTALFTSLLGRTLPWRSLELSALVDAFYLVKILQEKGRYPSEKSLESLGLIRLPGGWYYLSPDDHYGLLPSSVGVFTYEAGEFRPLCPPKALGGS